MIFTTPPTPIVWDISADALKNACLTACATAQPASSGSAAGYITNGKCILPVHTTFNTESDIPPLDATLEVDVFNILATVYKNFNPTCNNESSDTPVFSTDVVWNITPADLKSTGLAASAIAQPASVTNPAGYVSSGKCFLSIPTEFTIESDGPPLTADLKVDVFNIIATIDQSLNPTCSNTPDSSGFFI